MKTLRSGWPDPKVTKSRLTWPASCTLRFIEETGSPTNAPKEIKSLLITTTSSFRWPVQIHSFLLSRSQHPTRNPGHSSPNQRRTPLLERQDLNQVERMDHGRAQADTGRKPGLEPEQIPLPGDGL